MKMLLSLVATLAATLSAVADIAITPTTLPD